MSNIKKIAYYFIEEIKDRYRAEGRYTKTTYLGKGKSRKMICITYKPKTI